jgi:hypothetical protein
MQGKMRVAVIVYHIDSAHNTGEEGACREEIRKMAKKRC